MNPKLRPFAYFLLSILFLFLLTKPYNWFCNFSKRCPQIYISELLPSREGKINIQAEVEVRNYRRDIEFEALDPLEFNTVSGRTIIVKYRIKNISEKFIKFRPKFYAESNNAKRFDLLEFVRSYECLCFKDIKLKANQEVVVQSILKFDPYMESYMEEIFEGSNVMDVKFGYILR
jgi:cytochrome c oxidase assembly protein Cox11